MSWPSTEKAKFIRHPPLAFFRGQFTILSELGGEIGFSRSPGVRRGGGPVGCAGGGGCTGILVCRTGFLVPGFSFVRSFGVAGGIRLLLLGVLSVVWVGLALVGHLGVAFPVVGVDPLCQISESGEGVGFSDTGDFVLDARRHCLVESVMEGRVPPSDLRC